MNENKKAPECQEQEVSDKRQSNESIEVKMMAFENEHRDAIKHFGYTEEDIKGNCLLFPRKYGALFFLEFYPPISKCRITIDYEYSETAMTVDFDPDYPRSIVRFIDGRKQHKKPDL